MVIAFNNYKGKLYNSKYTYGIEWIMISRILMIRKTRVCSLKPRSIERCHLN